MAIIRRRCNTVKRCRFGTTDSLMLPHKHSEQKFKKLSRILNIFHRAERGIKDSSDYKSHLKKENCWQKVATAINVDVAIVKNCFKSLREKYRRELKLEEAATTTNIPPDTIHSETLRYKPLEVAESSPESQDFSVWILESQNAANIWSPPPLSCSMLTPRSQSPLMLTPRSQSPSMLTPRLSSVYHAKNKYKKKRIDESKEAEKLNNVLTSASSAISTLATPPQISTRDQKKSQVSVSIWEMN
ncbi:hypothetical protein ABEB36_012770 [Hypothenemus hampei]|uniref:MADF domain-containing protein n=1 Tax=Hypothenemus hampei TaxID=57062 RepID=A0ABD1ECC2_HYPHA